MSVREPTSTTPTVQDREGNLVGVTGALAPSPVGGTNGQVAVVSSGAWVLSPAPFAVSLTQGAVTASSVTASTGDVTATAGDITATAGRVFTGEGDVIAGSVSSSVSSQLAALRGGSRVAALMVDTGNVANLATNQATFRFRVGAGLTGTTPETVNPANSSGTSVLTLTTALATFTAPIAVPEDTDTITWTGPYATSEVSDIYTTKLGNVVLMSFNVLSGTYDGDNVITGSVPAAFRPTSAKSFRIFVENNGNVVPGTLLLSPSQFVVTVGDEPAVGNFTTGSTCGFLSTAISYSLT